MRRRASLFVFSKDSILLIRRLKNGREYYVLPGGGIEAGERPWQAALRELEEETGLQTDDLTFFAEERVGNGRDHYFVVETSTRDVHMTGPEVDRMSPDNVYELLWIDCVECKTITLLPEEAYGIIALYFERRDERSTADG